MSIKVILLRDFLKDVKRLRKRYRRIEDDVEELVAEIERSELRGILMHGFGRDVFKVRLANRSAGRGRRGGFRVVYSPLNADTVVLLHIYLKSEKDNVSAGEVWRLLRDFE